MNGGGTAVGTGIVISCPYCDYNDRFIGEQNISAFDLRLTAFFIDRDTVATLDEIALGKHSTDNAETAWR